MDEFVSPIIHRLFKKDANLAMYNEKSVEKWSSNTPASNIPQLEYNSRLVLTTRFTPQLPGYMNIVAIDQGSKMCKLLWTSGH